MKYYTSTTEYLYEAEPRNDEALKAAIHQVAKTRLRWGSPRIADRLKREGWKDNHKRIERIYREEKLQVQRRRRKRMARGEREPLIQPSRVNQVWAMDFMSDQLATGRRIRLLNILDAYPGNVECDVLRMRLAGTHNQKHAQQQSSSKCCFHFVIERHCRLLFGVPGFFGLSGLSFWARLVFSPPDCITFDHLTVQPRSVGD